MATKEKNKLGGLTISEWDGSPSQPTLQHLVQLSQELSDTQFYPVIERHLRQKSVCVGDYSSVFLPKATTHIKAHPTATSDASPELKQH